MGELLPEKCHRFPMPLEVCPTCKHGIKQTRGWAWVNPKGFFDSDCDWRRFNEASCPEGSEEHCDDCPCCYPALFEGPEQGLLWVGESFYSTPADFYKEAVELGVSRRINAVPRGYIPGEHHVFLAHPKATYCGPPDYREPRPGIFHLWRPERIEKVITQTMSEDHEFMNKLYLQGLTPFIVPDNDLDHNPKEI